MGLTDRTVAQLSGGELQRFAIAARSRPAAGRSACTSCIGTLTAWRSAQVVAAQNADIYMFDEPSSYLDVKQRLKAARVIRSLLDPVTYVIVVEHDLSVCILLASVDPEERLRSRCR